MVLSQPLWSANEQLGFADRKPHQCGQPFMHDIHLVQPFARLDAVVPYAMLKAV